MPTPRKFDHDQARAMATSGKFMSEIADHFGVSETAVRRIVDPHTQQQMREAIQRYGRRNRKTPIVCPDCGRERCRIKHDIPWDEQLLREESA